MIKREDKPDEDIDALFRLPLAEFTDERNTLAARLKKSGRSDEAQFVKALGKPPISAWAVNQLYWNHRKAFDQLIASGERFHKAQASGKVAQMREAMDARRESLSRLSEMAAAVMTDAGHNPSLDTVRRVNSTLEALSVVARRPDAPRPGRLTHDVDPPGFESLASFVPSAATIKTRREPDRDTSTRTSASRITNTRQKKAAVEDFLRVEETQKKRTAAAKASFRDAKNALIEARTRIKNLEAAKRKADADAKRTEQRRRAAEEELLKAKAASEEAAQQARSVEAAVKEAARSVDNAEREVEKVTQELESLLRQ